MKLRKQFKPIKGSASYCMECVIYEACKKGTIKRCGASYWIDLALEHYKKWN